jgi:hypothetical protein
MTTTNHSDSGNGIATGTDRDWLAEQVRSEPGLRYLEALRSEASTAELYPLLLDVWRLVLDLPDPEYVAVVLATWVANNLEGQRDPAWLMIVAPPASGKTAVIGRLSSLPETHMVSSLTVGGLLSGTPTSKKTAEATGGLLQEIGESGVLLLKDFTTTLEAPADSRAQTMSALREVYDGEFSRAMGIDGGVRLVWKGKLGIIAAVTDAIDHHAAGWAEMGARFLCYRLDDPMDRTTAARKALRGRSGEHEMELRAVNAAHLEQALSTKVGPLTQELEEFVIVAADVGARLRSLVPRQHSGEVNGEVRLEGPARMAKALDSVLRGLISIGVPDADVRRVVSKLAGDSAFRSRTVCLMHIVRGRDTTAEISKATGISEKVCRRLCDDLARVNLTEVDTAGSKHRFAPTDIARRALKPLSGGS